MEAQQSPWPLQDDRRWQVLVGDQVRQRERRLHRRAARPDESRHHLGVQLRATARAVLPAQWRRRQRALEVHRCRQDLHEGVGRRVPDRHAGPHRDRDRALRPAHHVHAGRGGHAHDPGKGSGAQAAGKAQWAVSQRGCRRHVDAHQHRERAAILLLAGACRSAERRSRVLVVHAGEGVRRRRSDRA